MSRNRSACAPTVLVVLVLNGSALAAQVGVSVDPGPVGLVADNLISVDLPLLVGVDFPEGETLFDFCFDDAKYISLSGLSTEDKFFYELCGTHTPVAYALGLADGTNGDYASVYYVSNQAGEPLSSYHSAAAGSNKGVMSVGVEYRQSVLDLEGAFISGVHLGFDASDEFQLISATLTLQLTGSGTMRIGRVPEPATSSPAILAAFALAFRRRSRAIV